MPASFDPAAVEAAIAGTQFSGTLQHFTTVGSTSTLALEAAQAGAVTGVWVADEQTAGRGRGGHGWHSAPDDGLYVSVLVRPRLPLDRSLWLALAIGLAARSAVAGVTGLTPDIRWPNDLLLSGKKCGGILVETAVTSQAGPALRYAVIGVGINVNHAGFPAELTALATSLRLQTGRGWAREAVLSALLCALDGELQRLEADAMDVLDRFAAASTWVRGTRVHVDEGSGYNGVTAGLDAKGFLLVDRDDGVRQTVLSGGVRMIS